MGRSTINFHEIHIDACFSMFFISETRRGYSASATKFTMGRLFCFYSNSFPSFHISVHNKSWVSMSGLRCTYCPSILALNLTFVATMSLSNHNNVYQIRSLQTRLGPFKKLVSLRHKWRLLSSSSIWFLPGLNCGCLWNVSSLTSIDLAGDLLWSLVSKGLATMCADWMFNLVASKLRSEHISHNGRHSSRWPLLSAQQLSGRQTDKEILCMCVSWLRRRRYRKETKVLIWTILRSHRPSCSPLSLYLFLLA